MRNAQLKPGYNVQISVDSEYIVAVDIFQDRNLISNLRPMRNGKNTALKKISANVKTWDMMRPLTHTPAMPEDHCPLFLSKGRKRLYISKSFLEKRQESYENILSETGIKFINVGS